MSCADLLTPGRLALVLLPVLAGGVMAAAFASKIAAGSAAMTSASASTIGSPAATVVATVGGSTAASGGAAALAVVGKVAACALVAGVGDRAGADPDRGVRRRASSHDALRTRRGASLAHTVERRPGVPCPKPPDDDPTSAYEVRRRRIRRVAEPGDRPPTRGPRARVRDADRTRTPRLRRAAARTADKGGQSGANGVASGVAEGPVEWRRANGQANGAANGQGSGVAKGQANGVANGPADGVAKGQTSGAANGQSTGKGTAPANAEATGSANAPTSPPVTGQANAPVGGSALHRSAVRPTHPRAASRAHRQRAGGSTGRRARRPRRSRQRAPRSALSPRARAPTASAVTTPEPSLTRPVTSPRPVRRRPNGITRATCGHCGAPGRTARWTRHARRRGGPMSKHPAPPFDPELDVVLQTLADKVPPTITPDMIERFRALPADPTVGRSRRPSRGTSTTSTRSRATAVATSPLSVFRPSERGDAGPGILYLHGGGMVFGNRFGGVQAYLPFIASHGAVVVAVDYRLAPEHPDPVPVEDCFAALQWIVANAAELGIDPDRLIVAGQSAGAGLAAGVCLLARERGARPSRRSCSSARCSTTATTRSRPSRSTGSASGIARATSPGGRPSSAIVAAAMM